MRLLVLRRSFPTGRGYGVHYGAKLSFPLLGQAGLAQCLKVGLHGRVHGQEVALEEAAERGGRHLSHLEVGVKEAETVVKIQQRYMVNFDWTVRTVTSPCGHVSDKVAI